MGKLSYTRKEAKWRSYNKFEDAQRASALKKMSEEDGFRILKDLYQFAYKIKNKTHSEKQNRDKIKTLSDIHSIFGKVKM